MVTSLTTLTDVKSYLGISVTTWDTILSTLITQVSASIEDYCERTFGVTDYVDYYNGKRLVSILQLRNYPVVTFTDIREDAARVFGSTSVIPTTNYAVDNASGTIYFDGWRLSYGIKSVKVTYSAGYSTLPPAVVLACHKLMGAAFNKRKDDGQAGASLGGVNFSYSADWTPDIHTLLDGYVVHEASE